MDTKAHNPVDPAGQAAGKTLKRHNHLRRGIIPYLGDYTLPVILFGPVIYSTVVPLVILDLWLTLYQWICFPVYGIKRVRRRDYIAIDRHQLAYLNVLEKWNCVFCGYANGLLAYVVEIASLTEQFWCPIKHAARKKGEHARAATFAEYTDAAGYRVRQKQNSQKARCTRSSGRACDGCE